LIFDDEVWFPGYTIFGLEVQKTYLAPRVILQLGIEQDFQTSREAYIYSIQSYIIASDTRYEVGWIFEELCRTSSETWCRKEQGGSITYPQMRR
jgi:hypothetical protein